jgi:hypothetical protein
MAPLRDRQPIVVPRVGVRATAARTAASLVNSDFGRAINLGAQQRDAADRVTAALRPLFRGR